MLGTYEGPNNWSPPAGMEGPFFTPYDLKHPYYEYTRMKSYYIYAWYGGIKQLIKQVQEINGRVDYYGFKK